MALEDRDDRRAFANHAVKARIDTLAMEHARAMTLVLSHEGHIASLQTRLSDIEDDFRAVMAEDGCDDKQHCSCVPHLRKALSAVQAENVLLRDPVTNEEWRILADDHKRIMAELAAAQEECERLTDEWELMYAGRECPQCGKHVTMNVEDDLPDVFQRRLTSRLAALRADDAGRVERIRRAYEIAWESLTKSEIGVGMDKRWFSSHPTHIEAMFKLGDEIRAVLAADGEVKP